ncbi:hypothetical protein GYMLUDRAFT_42720 [Collybiopsis luxurians FD-317 M1]|uniref:Uncharacterized protein n=1 Tax=Collybiopsis luxurians FD-317 M1 TaxID=944289 RepID=A0A0D0CYZ5_9AGAR|nr:hypothetical protein GYMLUDRAFT_42720 [Collybiopsis luxurians FD-317 M1]
MTNEESKHFRGSTIFETLSGCILACVLFGGYFLALLVAIYISFEKGVSGRPQKILWKLMVLLLICNIWNLGQKITYVILDVWMLSDAAVLYSGEKVLARQASIPFAINVLVGDGIVVWRAWGIWTESRMAKLILVILMIGNIGTNIADVIIDITHDAFNRAIVMDYVWSTFSLAVNFFATLLIALKAWYYRRTLRSCETKHNHLRKILILLVESGLVYCIIQITFVLIQIFTVRSELRTLRILTIGISQIINGTAVLYPLAIFLVVNLDQSLADIIHGKSSASATLTTLAPD